MARLCRVTHVGEEINFPSFFPMHSTCAYSHLTMSPFSFFIFKVFGQNFVGIPCLLWQRLLQLFISCCVGRKNVEGTKNNYPWIICVKQLPLSLLAADPFHGRVWYLKQRSQAVFLNTLPCHVCIHCYHKACIVLFKIKVFFFVSTAKKPLYTWISQLLHQLSYILWGGMVCSIYCLSSWKFFWFSTTCHNLNLLSQVDTDYLQSQSLSLHA